MKAIISQFKGSIVVDGETSIYGFSLDPSTHSDDKWRSRILLTLNARRDAPLICRLYNFFFEGDQNHEIRLEFVDGDKGGKFLGHTILLSRAVGLVTTRRNIAKNRLISAMFRGLQFVADPNRRQQEETPTKK
jgi:hypothetical protein